MFITWPTSASTGSAFAARLGLAAGAFRRAAFAGFAAVRFLRRPALLGILRAFGFFVAIRTSRARRLAPRAAATYQRAAGAGSPRRLTAPGRRSTKVPMNG